MGRRGFSLIELLVVVAVISLLIAILLPSLGQARSLARMSACMGRMDTNLTALGLFANENNQCLPPFAIATPSTGWARSQQWGGTASEHDPSFPRTGTETVGLWRLAEDGFLDGNATHCPSAESEPGWFPEGQYHSDYALRMPYSEDLFAVALPVLQQARSLERVYMMAAGGTSVRVGDRFYTVPLASISSRLRSYEIAGGAGYLAEMSSGAWLTDSIWSRGPGSTGWAHGPIFHTGWADGAVTRIEDTSELRLWTGMSDPGNDYTGETEGATSERVWAEVDRFRP